MSILLFEPHFVSFTGHYNRYVRVIGAEATKRGDRVVVAASQNVSPSVREYFKSMHIDILPVFPAVNFNIVKFRDEQVRNSNLIFNAAISAYEKHADSKVAWLSGVVSLVEPACRFAEVAGKPFPFQLLNFSREWGAGVGSAPARLRRILARGASVGMRLYAQTEFVAKVASEECGQRFLPFLPILDFKEERPPRGHVKPNVGLMNVALPHKDFPAVLEALREHMQNIQLVVHTGHYFAKEGDEFAASAEKIGARIYKGALDPNLYNEVWQSLDATILPYSVEKYSRTGSGMYFEALADGIIAIVPDRTSMAALARDAGVGIVYDAGDPAGLTNAIKRLLRDFESLARASREFAPVWCERNRPSRVVDMLEAAWES